MNSVKQAPWQADALLLLVTALAAGGWIFSKEALAGMPPLLFIGTRFLLAGLILLGFAWPTLTRMPLRRVRRGLLVGAGAERAEHAVCVRVEGGRLVHGRLQQ